MNDEHLAALLQHLRRHEAPDIEVDTILARWQRRRRRAMASAGFALAALVLGAVILRPSPPEPPVHLELRVMDVTEAENGDPLAEVFDPRGRLFGP